MNYGTAGDGLFDGSQCVPIATLTATTRFVTAPKRSAGKFDQPVVLAANTSTSTNQLSANVGPVQHRESPFRAFDLI